VCTFTPTGSFKYHADSHTRETRHCIHQVAQELPCDGDSRHAQAARTAQRTRGPGQQLKMHTQRTRSKKCAYRAHNAPEGLAIDGAQLPAGLVRGRALRRPLQHHLALLVTQRGKQLALLLLPLLPARSGRCHCSSMRTRHSSMWTGNDLDAAYQLTGRATSRSVVVAVRAGRLARVLRCGDADGDHPW